MPTIIAQPQAKPIVTVSAQAPAVVAEITVRGPQGAEGPSGPEGPAGITTGFGQVTYTHSLSADEEVLAQGSRTQLTFMPDQGTTQDYLNAPFAGFAFWDGAVFRGRQFADLIDVQVNLQVRSITAGGSLQIDFDAGSPLGPIVSDTTILYQPAGVLERVTLGIRFQTLTYVMTNGGRIYMTASVPLRIVKESLLIAPQSEFAGS